MHLVFRFSVALGLAILSSAPAGADRLPRPTVAYAADLVMQTREGGQGGPMTLTGRVYATPDKERREIEMMGRRNVLITRRDKGVTWILMAEQAMYMERPIRHGGDDDPDPFADWDNGNLKMTKLGTEKVNGVKATKYRVELDNDHGGRDHGLLWLTKDNIPVRLEATDTSEGAPSHVTMDYKNLKVGKQDPQLFEIPAGYHPMAMPSFGGIPPSRGTAPPPGQLDEEQMRRLGEQLQQQMGNRPHPGGGR